MGAALGQPSSLPQQAEAAGITYQAAEADSNRMYLLEALPYGAQCPAASTSALPWQCTYPAGSRYGKDEIWEV